MRKLIFKVLLRSHEFANGSSSIRSEKKTLLCFKIGFLINVASFHYSRRQMVSFDMAIFYFSALSALKMNSIKIFKA